ncbi:hypothetical protein FLJC2902T_32530 [Flavobacterium limnosediminis JC2902]|uniref:Uncharacterized protein n=1 Tax=Flavobacterium limnosediminis JC2902 TaxID=1341181 RepID=V6S826_9FLAO|nr:hypothetical protein [Flavobacterium limnosediminis]ESU22791.1 hypothetical protein FLJC2902T_32530 [Flavobacterium limnosediminis JC2902]
MNKFLQIILILLPNLLFCQIKTFNLIEKEDIIYEKELSDTDRYQTLIHQINISENSTFEFRHTPYVSCLTWKEYKGTWKQKRDTIIFTDFYVLEESDIKFEHSTLKENKFYDFTFVIDSQKKYSNESVEISFVYDLDSKIKNKQNTFITDSNGNIQIPFSEIENLDKLTAFRIQINLNGEKKWNHFTTNNFVNVKKEELPNKIDVNIISKPSKETIKRETKAILSNENLRIISSRSEKSKLSNYSNRLNFSNNYKRTYY